MICGLSPFEAIHFVEVAALPFLETTIMEVEAAHLLCRTNHLHDRPFPPPRDEMQIRAFLEPRATLTRVPIGAVVWIGPIPPRPTRICQTTIVPGEPMNLVVAPLRLLKYSHNRHWTLLLLVAIPSLSNNIRPCHNSNYNRHHCINFHKEVTDAILPTAAWPIHQESSL